MQKGINGMVLSKSIFIDYSNAKKELERVESQLERYSKLQPHSEHGVVKGSMKEYPYAEKHYVLSGSDVKSDEMIQQKIAQAIISLREHENKCLELMIDVDMAIENISDLQMRTILHEKYYNGLTDKQIADKLGYDRSTVTKKLSDFFKEIEQKQ